MRDGQARSENDADGPRFVDHGGISVANYTPEPKTNFNLVDIVFWL